MSKAVKEMMIKQIRERIGNSRDLLVVDTSRMDAVSDNQFRVALREKGIQILQVKNSLARKAVEEAGAGSLAHCLIGPSALVWGSEDAVALSKEITAWAKKLEPLQVKGATIDGQPLDAAGVESLSKSPGRKELLCQLSGLILSPGARLSAALLGPGGLLQGQLTTLSTEDAEAPAA
jgi:large subunit ribosomal protein L10